MGKKKKITGILTIIIALLFLMPGCTSHSSGDMAFTHLEKAASQEDGFNQQQGPLIKEEKDEQDLYQKIMALDMSKYDQIKEYCDQALSHVDQRAKLMEKEKESIDDAYDTFKEAIPNLKKINNKKAQPHAEKVIDEMTKRYKEFQALYDTYSHSIKYDRTLFTMLKDKSLTKDNLTKQLKIVNDAYDEIENHKNAFNNLTQSFNDEKRSLYKVLNLNEE